MLKITIRLALIVVGSLAFALCVWQAVPFAEPQPLRMPAVEEWAKPYGPDYKPPVKDHLPSEYYQQPFDRESLERQ